MGSFKGHVLPGSMFLFVGIWHLYACIQNYLRDLYMRKKTSSYKARTWHPATCLPKPVRLFELQALCVGTFLDACLELFYSTHLVWFVDGKLNPSHLNDFEHGAMLIMFFIYATTALLSETTSLLPLPTGTLHLVVSGAFASELLLFYFHSTSHAGLEGRYHLLLVICIAAGLAFTLLLVWKPDSFLIDLAGNMALTMQGLWFYQIAFSLYWPRFIVRGCHLQPTSEVDCDSEGEEAFGMALASLQFAWHLAAVTFLVVVLYAASAWRQAARAQAEEEANRLELEEDDHRFQLGDDDGLEEVSEHRGRGGGQGDQRQQESYNLVTAKDRFAEIEIAEL